MALYLWIAIGSAIGGVARYWCSGVAARLIGETFPWGTLIVNVLGSFLIGVIQQIGLTTLWIPDTLRVVLAIGVMGGFTTYSSFSYEAVKLVESGSWTAAAAYVALTTVLCLGGCTAGIALGGLLVEGKGGW